MNRGSVSGPHRAEEKETVHIRTVCPEMEKGTTTIRIKVEEDEL